MQIDEALAEPAAVVAGGDPEQVGGVEAGGDGRLCRGCNRRQIRAVDDDLLNAGDPVGQAGFDAGLAPQRRAVFRVGAGDAEFVLAPGLAAAGGDSAGEG